MFNFINYLVWEIKNELPYTRNLGDTPYRLTPSCETLRCLTGKIDNNNNKKTFQGKSESIFAVYFSLIIT